MSGDSDGSSPGSPTDPAKPISGASAPVDLSVPAVNSFLRNSRRLGLEHPKLDDDQGRQHDLTEQIKCVLIHKDFAAEIEELYR